MLRILKSRISFAPRSIWFLANNVVVVVVASSLDRSLAGILWYDSCLGADRNATLQSYQRVSRVSLLLYLFIHSFIHSSNATIMLASRTQFLRRVATRFMSTEAAAAPTTVKLNFSLPHETIYKDADVSSVIIPGM